MLRRRTAEEIALLEKATPSPATPSPTVAWEAHLRLAADMLAQGDTPKQVARALMLEFSLSEDEAWKVLRDVHTVAHQVLGDETRIAAHMLRTIGRLEKVSEALYGDVLEEPPDLVLDAETGCPTEPSVDTRVKMKAARASSARAFADIQKVTVGIVGARSIHYGRRPELPSDGEETDPQKKAAIERFFGGGS